MPIWLVLTGRQDEQIIGQLHRHQPKRPKEMYGKTLSIPDSLIYDYFLLATVITRPNLVVKKRFDGKSVNPRDISGAWRELS